MAARRALLACLLLASLASGCLSDQTSGAPGAPGADAQTEAPQEGLPASSDEDAPEAQADDGDGAGPADDADPAEENPSSDAVDCHPPAVHGDPQRDDGPVDTASEAATFVARRIVTIGNDFGGAEASKVLLKSFNGAIFVTPSADCDYHLVAELYGRGATPEDARQALDLLTLTATDDLGQGTLGLSFVLTSGAPETVLPVGLGNGVNNGAIFRLSVPSGPAHDLEAETSNAAISAEALHGPRLKATSANAVVSVEGRFTDLDLGTSNAAILLVGTFKDIVAETSNAAIDAELRPVQSGSVQLSTSNAVIDVRLPVDASAFDITADVLNGQVRFDLEGRESADDGHATFRSSDWASATVRVTIELGTSNASILVED